MIDWLAGLSGVPLIGSVLSAVVLVVVGALVVYEVTCERARKRRLRAWADRDREGAR